MSTTSPRSSAGRISVVDVVGLVGGEQQRLGPRRDVVAVQHEVADVPPERGAARLAGDDDRATRASQRLAQQRHLGRLARAVAALEGDEQPVVRRAGGRLRAGRRRGRVGSGRVTRPA